MELTAAASWFYLKGGIHPLIFQRYIVLVMYCIVFFYSHCIANYSDTFYFLFFIRAMKLQYNNKTSVQLYKTWCWKTAEQR